MQTKRGHLSYANIVSTLALIVAVAGIPAAVAVTKAKKNSVTSKSIVNGTIKTKDLAANAVTTEKIAAGHVTAADLAAGEVIRNEAVNPVAACPRGSQLLGAGGSDSGGLTEVQPFFSPTLGEAVAANGLAPPSATAYALCLKATPGN